LRRTAVRSPSAGRGRRAEVPIGCASTRSGDAARASAGV